MQNDVSLIAGLVNDWANPPWFPRIARQFALRNFHNAQVNCCNSYENIRGVWLSFFPTVSQQDINQPARTHAPQTKLDKYLAKRHGADAFRAMSREFLGPEQTVWHAVNHRGLTLEGTIEDLIAVSLIILTNLPLPNGTKTPCHDRTFDVSDIDGDDTGAGVDAWHPLLTLPTTEGQEARNRVIERKVLIAIPHTLERLAFSVTPELVNQSARISVPPDATKDYFEFVAGRRLHLNSRTKSCSPTSPTLLLKEASLLVIFPLAILWNKSTSVRKMVNQFLGRIDGEKGIFKQYLTWFHRSPRYYMGRRILIDRKLRQHVKWHSKTEGSEWI